MTWTLIALLLACGPYAAPTGGTGAPDLPFPSGSTGSTGATGLPTETGTPPGPPPAVVLVIGDGMGPAHMEAGSWYAHGAPGRLAIDALPVQNTLRTASLSGITDSAAAGTTLACGVHTVNERIGQDVDARDLPCVLELARSRGWATGVVTTARLPHATPATFTAHHPDRDEELIIAAEQVGSTDLLLGGGWAYMEGAEVAGSLRTDDGLLDEMEAAGITWVRDREALADAPLPLIGAFAPAHLPYVQDRPTEVPSLVELVDVALDKLGDDPDGLFLVVEGARIDHASHGNDLERMVHEMVELDEVVARLEPWLAERDGVLVVTADHDCGGLHDVVGTQAGVMPEGRWRWGNHSNIDVRVSALGPGTEALRGEGLDARAVHAVLAEAIDGSAPALEPVLVPDGVLADLPLVAATQAASSSLGNDQGRLEALRLGIDGRGLGIGVEGVFPWVGHAVVVLLDVDAGAGTGLPMLQGQLSDDLSPTERLIRDLRVGVPPDEGLGIDVALVSLGGIETPYLPTLRGGRGLVPPFGQPDAFGRIDVALNYAVPTRTTPTLPLMVAPERGFEALVPWTSLWPELGGSVPPGTEIGVAVGLVEQDGTWTNQVLPPLPAGSAAPVGGLSLPAMVRVAVDPDGDGVPADAVLR